MAMPAPSPQGTCPWGSHLPAGSQSGPVPCRWARFTHKGANGASWLHAMDTCPLSLGPEIGDFHKDRQQLAGRPRQAIVIRLNWRQRPVCNTASPLPPRCFILSSRSLPRGVPRTQGAFLGLFVPPASPTCAPVWKHAPSSASSGCTAESWP